LLSIPSLAAADETFVQQATVVIPGVPLASFDISWVDAAIHTYFLADRSNKSIDLINTHSKAVSQLIPTGADAFAGPVPGANCPDGQANDCAGPNGVLTITKSGEGDRDHDGDDRSSTQVWAGDGPTPQSKATTGADCAAHPPGSTVPLNGKCSTVKIFQLGNSDPIRIIPTNGQERADELCYDPHDHLVMIANDADTPPFVTFISTEGNNRVLGQLQLPQAQGGVEQCGWNPRNGLIYLALPAPSNVGGTGTVVIIDPRHETIVGSVPEDANCSANGLAIGPDHQILLGCNKPGEAAILDDRTNTITDIPGQGGSDEVWFNPGDGHYFLAESKNAGGPQLGIIDSLHEQSDTNVPGTGSSSHSVAADPESNQVYVPINAGSGTLCGTFAAQGCVAIFGPSGPDDHPVFVAREHHDDR
jgi:hypothetical protein